MGRSAKAAGQTFTSLSNFKNVSAFCGKTVNERQISPGKRIEALK